MTPEREAEIRAEHNEPRDGRCDACDLLAALDAERARVAEWTAEARERDAEVARWQSEARDLGRALADVRQRCGGYPDSRVDGDGGIVAVVVRERDDARRSIACARYCLENDHGEAAVRACLDGMGMAPGIAEEYQSDLDRVTRERDEARETARRDADLRDDAEQQRNQAQAALVALREAARGVGYACAAAATWSDDPRPALLALDAAAAATPTTLAGQVRARVLRDIADSLDAEAAMPNDGNVHTLRHVMFWERMTPIEGRVVAAWLRALADEAEETR